MIPELRLSPAPVATLALGALEHQDADPVSTLSQQELVDHRVHRERMEALLDRQQCHCWEMPYDSGDAFWTHLGLTLRMPR